MEPDPAPSLLSSTHPSAPPLPPLPVRNNSKLREKGKKEEGRNLREFVDAAYKMDPRVAKKKEDERLERCVLAHACCGLMCGWNGACFLMPAVASCAYVCMLRPAVGSDAYMVMHIPMCICVHAVAGSGLVHMFVLLAQVDVCICVHAVAGPSSLNTHTHTRTHAQSHTHAHA